jgi:hypothetical protein
MRMTVRVEVRITLNVAAALYALAAILAVFH